MRDNEAHWKMDAIREELRSIATGLSEDQAARRAAPPVGDDGLPPLPEPTSLGWNAATAGVRGYTADQARQAQREAYEAGRRAAVPAQMGTQPAGDSVDTPEFRELLRHHDIWRADDITIIVDHINAWVTRRAAVSTASAPEHADWCIGGAKGPCNCRTPSSPVE